ncbi:hypothetical protein KPH14_010332 [Odynerus spinipes]|uniref:Uncharacterized protein n=1 Tax=Odynerus spinipes TaxID=1348599 RepID=A0AAD9RTU5_9HYME|nr:hypothetical protein KPH14_010332 [Odynerus spinipes]
MSSDVEKGLPENTERDYLLDGRDEFHVTCCADQQAQRHHQYHHHHHHHGHNHRRPSRHQQDIARSPPIYEKSNRIEPIGSVVDGSSHGVTSTTLPSIVVSDVDENDEDPPPYSAIAPPDHVGWPFVFSTHIPYSVHATQPCITEPPLAPFQTPSPLPLPLPLTPTTAAALASPIPSLQASTLQPPPTYRVEPPSLDRPTPTLSLTPYRFFKFGSHRSLFSHRTSIFDNASTGKEVQGRSRRYGAILVAAAVIVFLMVLSLMVRFVMERSFWRR